MLEVILVLFGIIFMMLDPVMVHVSPLALVVLLGALIVS